MARVLVMGAGGFLGSELCMFLADAQHEVFRQGRGPSSEFTADPLEPCQVERLLDATNPDVVVNLIAETSVDACEDRPQMAYLANVRPVEVMLDAICDRNIHFVHVSTDQVYGGLGPHDEERVCPCNIYGLSKYTAELVASRCDATILRTNFVGRSRTQKKETFSDWAVRSLREKKPITLFEDIQFSPLHIRTLCGVIDLAVRRRIGGTFNAGCADGISKARFVLELAQRMKLDVGFAKVGKSADVSLAARRPSDMRLNVEKLVRAFGVSPASMVETIDLLAGDYCDGE